MLMGVLADGDQGGKGKGETDAMNARQMMHF